MSDAGVTAAIATTTGVLSIPILASAGIDPAAMGAGLLGCTIMQSFVQKDGQAINAAFWAKIAVLTFGSMLFASLVAPVAAPWVHVRLGEVFPKVPFPHEGVRAMTAGALGAFAQPIVMFGRMLLKKWVLDKLSKSLPSEGAGDA